LNMDEDEDWEVKMYERGDNENEYGTERNRHLDQRWLLYERQNKTEESILQLESDL